MEQVTLKAARVNVGLTQKEAAHALGVSNKTLSNWENGVSVPGADKIDLICALYDRSYNGVIFLPNNSL